MKTLSSLLTLAALVPAIWFHVTPDGDKFCVGDSYSVVRTDNQGKPQTLTFNSVERTEFCKLVKLFPRDEA